jgi:hypothetical protein
LEILAPPLTFPAALLLLTFKSLGFFGFAGFFVAIDNLQFIHGVNLTGA